MCWEKRGLAEQIVRWQQEGERVNVERVTEVPHFAKFELWLCLVRAQLGYATPRHATPRPATSRTSFASSTSLLCPARSPFHLVPGEHFRLRHAKAQCTCITVITVARNSSWIQARCPQPHVIGFWYVLPSLSATYSINDLSKHLRMSCGEWYQISLSLDALSRDYWQTASGQCTFVHLHCFALHVYATWRRSIVVPGFP